jgi:hypothetical protein
MKGMIKVLIFSLVLCSGAQTVANATEIDCARQEQKGWSPASSKPSDITFVNRGRKPVVFYWQDSNGKLRRYGEVPSKSRIRQPSYVGHIWIVKTLDGQCGGVFTVGENPTTANIRSSIQPTHEKQRPPRTSYSCMVSNVPHSLDAPSFYNKYCNANGIPILASAEVTNEAMVAAWIIVTNMIRNLSPPMRQALLLQEVRVAVIGRNQGTADIPEYASRKKKLGEKALNLRARGLGGRVASAGEENLICLRKDRYRGESILIHEFAHTIWTYGVQPADNIGTLDKRLKHAFNDARKRARLLNKYAGTNTAEYWAEGVQTFFDSNLPSDIKGINSRNRNGLALHDPALFKLIHEIFGALKVPHCHKQS